MRFTTIGRHSRLSSLAEGELLLIPTPTADLTRAQAYSRSTEAQGCESESPWPPGGP